MKYLSFFSFLCQFIFAAGIGKIRSTEERSTVKNLNDGARSALELMKL
ncbi:hypothetical protein [Synergistes jonesii]|nr:hypothetical protein [Synergistes jonesii]